jgi:hypothetical protein
LAYEVASFLSGALDLANQEPGTPAWMALRTDASMFWIVDAFPSDAERQTHLADRLLSAPPEVHMSEVLAIK